MSVATALAGCSEQPAEVVDKSPRPVNVIELGDYQGDFQQIFAGRLESVYEAHVSFRVPGTIEAIYVSPGDQVKKGDKLAQLDAHDYQVALIELEARLSEAESAKRLAESELRRVKQAISENAIAKVNLDRARSGYERARAAVEVVKQNIIKAEDAIRYTTLRAPFDGVVGQQKSEEYEQILPGIPVFQVHKLSQLEAVVDVPESLIQQFKYGQSVNVTWQDANQSFTAFAREIGTVPHPIKQTYSVVFQIDQANIPALPGKAVVVEADFSTKADVHCLPYGSVTKHNSKHSVFLVQDHRAVPTPVHVERLRGNDVCVSGA
ncbi:membrane fusion protein [Vibrio ishigakensis]|uniref:Membrane fusion protein n=1 Tax=Vibrio ishigakensis TaxID=1481914 RepID=A0A0B8P862_9VIBR|nr:membrane fusion protein [Vibrio ishigakensis]